MITPLLIVGIGTRLDAAVAAAHAPSGPGIVCTPPAEPTTEAVLLPQAHVIERYANSASNISLELPDEPCRRQFAHGWQKDH